MITILRSMCDTKFNCLLQINAWFIYDKFDFLSFHEIMNTSGLMQSLIRASLTLHETRSVHDLVNRQKSNVSLIFI